MSRLRLFVGIGLLVLPISVVITLLQALVLRASSILGIESEGGAASVFVLVVFAIGTALTLLGLGLVQAATARALIEIDNDRTVGPVRAYRMVVGSIRPLLGALVIGALAVSLLLLSIFLVPIAIWLAVRWALIVPAVELEELGPMRALGRSGRLVRGGWLKVGSLTIAAAAITLAAGPLIGTLLILFSDVPLGLLNVIAGWCTRLRCLVALTTMYVYFDARVRHQLSPPVQTRELPSEIDLGGPANQSVKPKEEPVYAAEPVDHWCLAPFFTRGRPARGRGGRSRRRRRPRVCASPSASRRTRPVARCGRSAGAAVHRAQVRVGCVDELVRHAHARVS